MRRALVLIVTLAVSACGGDGEAEGSAPPEEWVRTVCTTLTDWNGQLQQRTTELQAELGELSQGDFAGLQEMMVSYVDAVITDTDQAVSRIEGAGEPAVEDGQEASRLIVSGMRDARSIFEDASEEIAALDPDRPRRFTNELEEIGRRVEEGGARVQESFAQAEQRGVGGEELDQAFAEEPACGPLAGAGG